MINHSNDKIVQLIFNYNKISKIFTRTIFVMMKIFKGSVNSHIFFSRRNNESNHSSDFSRFSENHYFQKVQVLLFLPVKIEKTTNFPASFFQDQLP